VWLDVGMDEPTECMAAIAHLSGFEVHYVPLQIAAKYE
jgi:hypothetical protein